MEKNLKYALFLIGVGIFVGWILFGLLDWRVTKLKIAGAEIEPPTPTTMPILPTNTPVSTINQPVNQPTAIQTSTNTRFLSISRLKQVLDETSAERVEITVGKMREFCNQGIVICNEYSNSNWSVMGPSVIVTDPQQQPINGAQVIKVNKDKSGNWLPNWPIGLYYIPAGQNALVPTPGVAYPLAESLPAEWIIR